MENILILCGIIFPFLYFRESRNLAKCNKDYILLQQAFRDFKNNLKKDSLKRLNTHITPVGKKIKKSTNSNFNYSDIDLYESKKIDRLYLYPIKNLEDTGNYFYNKKVVITGEFNKFKNRNEIAKLLYEVGADVDVACGKYTDCLIVGDNAGETKIEFAEEFNIEIFYEENFLEEFENFH